MRSGGPWNLRYASIFFLTPLDSMNSFISDPFSIVTPHLAAGRRIYEFRDGDVANLREQLRSSPWSIGLPADLRPTTELAKGAIGYTFFPINHPQFQGHQRWPSLRMTGGGVTQEYVRDATRLEFELLSNPYPFADLPDLLGNLAVPANVLEHSILPTIDLIAAPPIRLGSATSLSSMRAQISVIALPSVATDQISFSLKTYQRPFAVRRLQFETRDLSWTSNNQFNVGTAQVDLPDCLSFEVFVRYRNEYVCRHFVRDVAKYPNSRLSIHKTIDKHDALRRLLDTRDANDFEALVALLFHILGFDAAYYGAASNLTDAPDLLLRLGNNLYVVECTTGDIGRKGKLHRAYRRTQDLRAAAEIQELGLAVFPVAVTNLERNATSGYWAEARNYELALVCKEELVQLLGTIEVPPTERWLTEQMKSYIPTTSRPEEPDLFGR